MNEYDNIVEDAFNDELEKIAFSLNPFKGASKKASDALGKVIADNKQAMVNVAEEASSKAARSAAKELRSTVILTGAGIGAGSAGITAGTMSYMNAKREAARKARLAAAKDAAKK